MKRGSVIGLLVLALGGCSDPDKASSVGGCSKSDDCPTGQVCVDNFCEGGPSDAVGFDAPQDTAIEDVLADTLTDAPKPQDTVAEDAKLDVGKDAEPTPDLIGDKTPPDLKTTDPKADTFDVALPFKVALTFTEGVKNIDKNTVNIKDATGKELKLVYTQDASGAVWTLTPAAGEVLMEASPYKVTVNAPIAVIQDQAGNKMQGIKDFIFYTATPKDTGKYADLAKAYAPKVRAGTPDANIQLAYPTAIDVDGDWDVKDNAKYLIDSKTKSIKAATHYSVIESESHFFISYVWFWSKRADDELAGDTFESDSAGATVVVEKWPEERPVEILTWFKIPNGEYIRAYQTSESQILVGDGKTMDQGAMDATYAQADLFPDGHYEAWLPSGKHESCLWIDPGTTGFVQSLHTCELLAADKETVKHVALTQNDKAAAIAKGDKWPDTGDLQYQLVDLFHDWWPRRLQTGTLFYDSTLGSYAWKLDALSKSASFPKYFVDAAGDQSKGRPIWAAVWAPGDGKQFTETPQAQFFLDPAAFLAARHKNSSYVATAFDKEALTGFSKAYCYEPYLGIDERGKSAACPK